MTQNSIDNKSSPLDVDNLNLNGNTISSTDTNGNVIIAPDGTGTVSVTAAPIVPSTDRADSLGSTTNSWNNVYANGVSFDDGTNILGTFVDTSTFTPVLEFGGGSTGITYSTQTGAYSRIGNVVFIFIRLILTSKGTSTGLGSITGLPFTVASHVTSLTPRWSFINLGPNYTFVGITCINGTTQVNLGRDGNNVIEATLSDVEFANNSELDATGFYYI